MSARTLSEEQKCEGAFIYSSKDGPDGNRKKKKKSLADDSIDSSGAFPARLQPFAL